MGQRPSSAWVLSQVEGRVWPGQSCSHRPPQRTQLVPPQLWPWSRHSRGTRFLLGMV